MRETITSKILRLDREMRKAMASYGIALTFFGFFGLLRLMALSMGFDVYNFVVCILMLSISILCIKAMIKIKAMRKDMAENPKKYIESNGPKPLSIETFFPFTRNAS